MGRRKKEEKNNFNDNQGGKPQFKFDVASEVKRGIIAVFLVALALLVVLSFFGKAGVAGEKINLAAALAVGWAKIILPFFLAMAGIVLFLRKKNSFYVFKIIGLAITLLGIAGLIHIFVVPEEMIAAARAGNGGGYGGLAVAYFLSRYFGKAGGIVVILALILTGIILTFGFSLFKAVWNFWKKEQEPETEKPAEHQEQELAVAENVLPVLLDPALAANKPEISKAPAPPAEEGNIRNVRFDDDPEQQTKETENGRIKITEFNQRKIKNFSTGKNRLEWELPGLELLEKGFGEPKVGDVHKSQRIIKETFSHFGIEVKEEEIRIGPSVTQYSFKPNEGIKISSIIALQDNLALSLAAHPIRIEAPIPGKSLIGVEVPNKAPSMVRLRNILEDKKYANRESSLTLALGKDVNNEFIFADLDKMPHLLIAGATNTGKSVCINSIITTLLYQNSPDDLQFLMVDPKRVELSRYDGIDHLLSPVIVDSSKVVNMLKWAVGEMERRYRLLQDVGSLNIGSYNEKANAGKKRKILNPETNEVHEEPIKKMSYIVIVIDELAELMSSHGKEVEGAIIRLAQMARAVGIHLIVSTQRPEVRVITGLIKANITNRIAFRVATQVDSRTILDMSGAEKLLGNGDLLYVSPSSPKPKRIQGVFISEDEVKKLEKFIKSQKSAEKNRPKPEIGEVAEMTGPARLDFSAMSDLEEEDEYYETAKAEVQRSGKASASYLQRMLRIGYPKAARLLDLLEKKGIIGPADGNKPREVFGSSAANGPQYDDPINDQIQRDKWGTD